MQADEVEVFGLFGGGLPVSHRTVTARAKGMGDRSHKPYGLMLFLNGIDKLIFHECAGDAEAARMNGELWTFMKMELVTCNFSYFSKKVNVQKVRFSAPRRLDEARTEERSVGRTYVSTGRTG